ncbi:oxidoreductase [Allopusillimonas soli]|uniref:NADPH--hemoprotein reductase n=1 Tax=Allopusillimonas soli TaxID=659016 RepID=A0A853FCJ5_9BURK|nr:sulfite reductase subunit alpha [Allopusillimonas soli]NYT37803.1 flavodoxin domain-containing protein [Allopusillimonas soli]TEA73713.1 oxidoreductase [Allopusillimonas soli]
MLERYLIAVCIAAAWCVLCLRAWRTHRRKATQEASTLAHAADGDIIVAYASQTGVAEDLANRTAASLRGAGKAALCLPLGHIDANLMKRAQRMLFVVSTTGEGDPPDAASSFVSALMAPQPADGAAPAAMSTLAHMRFALLALGDREYARFCAFGASLDDWLRRHGARPLFDRIDVDNARPESLDQWSLELSRALALSNPISLAPISYDGWTLARRQRLNPGNAEAPCFHIELRPPAGLQPAWQAGDIAEIELSAGTVDALPQHRQYSIASLPEDGAIHLLVRQVRKPDGQLGRVSGWLTETAAHGTAIPLRIRGNRNFHAPDSARRLILIGNGTGLAGLRAHLKARIGAGQHQTWLLFGERFRAHDYHYRENIESWHANGALARLDLAFSRDQAERIYVQHRLRGAATDIRNWVEQGAAIYVCGSRDSMAPGVHKALVDVLGTQTVQALMRDGRYRRDVY